VRFFGQIFVIARIEALFYKRYPRLLLASFFVALIPALQVLIYLASVWNPLANSGNLAVAIVNLDDGLIYRGTSFNVGQEVVHALKSKHIFGYQELSDEEEARRLVRQSKLAFALIIPRDFSSNALPGAHAGAGQLVIYASEGNSYQGAVVARRFADDLSHDVNETLNEKRWALVLTKSMGSERSVVKLRAGVDQLANGARELVSGSQRLADGVHSVSAGGDKFDKATGKLTNGFKELSHGLRKLDSSGPPISEVDKLLSSASALTDGGLQMEIGLTRLQDGNKKILEGVTQFRNEAAASPFVSSDVIQRIDQLAQGVTQIDAGLASSVVGQKKLNEGNVRLGEGIASLVQGVNTAESDIHAVVAKLPDDSVLDAYSDGADDLIDGIDSIERGAVRLHDGVARLSAGVDLLAKSIPVKTEKLDGSAKGLANSVQPVMQIDAPVSNNGVGFAPNIIPAALWLGAGIAAFLIHVRVMPREAYLFYRPAQLIGKLAMPCVVVLIQAWLVMFSMTNMMGIEITRPAPFLLTLSVSALAFLVMVFALTKAFGDAGKALALILLSVQLSSSGGVLPVELSGSLYIKISPFLPLTWVVKAIKSCMFGAYDGAWEFPLFMVMLSGLLASAMACYVGKWRFVKQSKIRPAVDI
jgi:putative membrane protein